MTLRRALIIDVETTGLDPAVHRCIEIGCILYDLAHASPIASCSYLLASEDNAAEGVNRIPTALLRDVRWLPNPWGEVQFFAEDAADVILAHRAEFDRSFVPPEIANAKPWICTKFHVDWPLGKPGDHLVHLALAHGLGVVHAHRAMADCDMISRLLTRVHEMGTPLVPLLEHAMRPRTKVRACVSYDDRELAKSAGFTWEPSTKRWISEVFSDAIASLPFRTEAI